MKPEAGHGIIEEGRHLRFEKDRVLTFQYTNWRGQTAVRRAKLISLTFGATEWHPEPQWLIMAVDMPTGAVRLFALKDVTLLDEPG